MLDGIMTRSMTAAVVVGTGEGEEDADEDAQDIEEIVKYSSMLTDNTLMESFSPNSRERFSRTIKRKRSHHMERIEKRSTS